MKIKYIFPAIALVFASCSDFLDEEPKSFLSPDGYYKTVEEINTGLNAVYRAPQDRYSRNWAGPSWFDWGTDVMEITDKNTWPQHNEIARLPTTFNASSNVPKEFWDYTYTHIKDANNLLKSMANVEIKEEERNRIEAQVRALRAFLYFDAARVFNEVPLLLETNVDVNYHKTMPRANAQEVYNAIIADLEYAMGVLPQRWENAADHGRITSGGAAAMLAKVYLTMSGYPLNQTDKLQSAKAIFDDLVENKKYGSHYALLPEYSQVFDDAVGPGSEGVWIINFTRSSFGQGSLIHTEFAPLELYYASGLGLNYGGGWSNGIPTDRFYNSYDKVNDKRFKHSYWNSTAEIPEEYDNIVPKDDQGKPQHIEFYRPHIKKFREKTPNDFSLGTSLDHSIIRYADVLLMYAEVLNELGDSKAYTYLNQVRQRAGLEPLQNMSKEDFKKHLIMERAWELCFEGDRKFDLLRWGIYPTYTPDWNPQVVGNIKADKHEFWPIPQSQRDLNPNLTQNQGW